MAALATAGPGATGRTSGAVSGAGRGSRSPVAVDRDLERQVARLGLRTFPRPRTSPGRQAPDDEDSSSSPRLADAAAAADAAIVEYRLREVLGERFSQHSQLVPWGYPVSALRAELAVEVAGLSTQERNELMALAAEWLPQQQPPLMAGPESGNVYRGRDGESNPPGVEIYVPPH